MRGVCPSLPPGRLTEAPQRSSIWADGCRPRRMLSCSGVSFACNDEKVMAIPCFHCTALSANSIGLFGPKMAPISARKTTRTAIQKGFMHNLPKFDRKLAPTILENTLLNGVLKSGLKTGRPKKWPQCRPKKLPESIELPSGTLEHPTVLNKFPTIQLFSLWPCTILMVVLCYDLRWQFMGMAFFFTWSVFVTVSFIKI